MTASAQPWRRAHSYKWTELRRQRTQYQLPFRRLIPRLLRRFCHEARMRQASKSSQAEHTLQWRAQSVPGWPMPSDLIRSCGSEGSHYFPSTAVDHTSQLRVQSPQDGARGQISSCRLLISRQRPQEPWHLVSGDAISTVIPPSEILVSRFILRGVRNSSVTACIGIDWKLRELHQKVGVSLRSKFLHVRPRRVVQRRVSTKIRK